MDTVKIATAVNLAAELLDDYSIQEVTERVLNAVHQEEEMTEEEAIKLVRHILRCAFSKLAREYSD